MEIQHPIALLPHKQYPLTTPVYGVRERSCRTRIHDDDRQLPSSSANHSDRGGIPFGTWLHRYIDWLRDVGFLKKTGIITKTANDVAKQ